ncbi:MAG: proprotein convertase P-domain-containing protein, partial [Anaerolineae bacterium]|nr:proprotein convertase P-domain-containing protein [Anaerolineae bacterium]
GTSAATSTSAAAQLTITAGTPAPTTLLTPANGAINQSSQPLLSWSAAAQATSYRLELSTNVGFAPIVYSAVVSGTSHTPSVNLQSSTIYYWRVIPLNSCGSGPASDIFSFATVAIACRTPNVSIPDGNSTGIASTITLTNTTPANGLKVYLDVSHTWVGDLSFKLTHVETGRSVTLIDRPGYSGQGFGCSGDNIDATFSDDAAKPAESSCTSASGLTDGPYSPNSPLSLFNGEALNGTWRLTAVDSEAPDAGQLNSWCLSPVGAPPAIPPAYTNYLPIILK